MSEAKAVQRWSASGKNCLVPDRTGPIVLASDYEELVRVCRELINESDYAELKAKALALIGEGK